MFEIALEDRSSNVFIDFRVAELLSQYGFSYDLLCGFNTLSYTIAVNLISRMYEMIPNIRYAKDKKRFESTINQIMFSFGPEFELRHRLK